jgi:ferredoxin
MADNTDKHTLNVPGRFYNDMTCIDCDLCREMAPQFFRRDDATANSYVWKQPETPEEIALAQDCLECCPTETIGKDG